MKRMTIIGHERMLGVPPRDPDLPPLPTLPPADGWMATKFVRKRVNVGGYSSETLVSFALAYGRLVLDAERERVAASLLKD